MKIEVIELNTSDENENSALVRVTDGFLFWKKQTETQYWNYKGPFGTIYPQWSDENLRSAPRNVNNVLRRALIDHIRSL